MEGEDELLAAAVTMANILGDSQPSDIGKGFSSVTLPELSFFNSKQSK